MPFLVREICPPTNFYYEGLRHLVNNYSEAISPNVVAEIDVSSLLRDHVVVPRITFTPCSTLQQELEAINPLQECSDHGIAFYNTAIHIAGEHLITECDHCVSD